MFDKFFSTYPYYQLVESPTEQMITVYEQLLPDCIMEFWRKYGWGVFMNGYLRFINPAHFQDFVDEYIEKAYDNDILTPFAVTALGDILVWVKSKESYVDFYDFRHSKSKLLSTEQNLDLFFKQDLVEQDFIWEELNSEQYLEAVLKLGIPDYDKCFGYIPLLAFGGNESVDKLQIVDLQTHLELMAQAVGAL